MSVKTQIPISTTTNFQTILDAQKKNRLTLLRAHDNVTDTDVTLVCVINLIEDEYEFVPIAIMIEEDPFVRFQPPV